MGEKTNIRAAFAGVNSPYETHRPVLCEAVLRVPLGPILELGGGAGSTPALHAVSQTGRFVITLENDRAWIERFAHLRSENHAIVHLPAWKDLENPVIRELPYAIAFVDHAPAEQRVIDIRWLAPQARVVVVHDTESKDYGYDTIVDLFRYSKIYRDHTPWTTVFSNFIDVSDWTFHT